MAVTIVDARTLTFTVVLSESSQVEE